MKRARRMLLLAVAFLVLGGGAWLYWFVTRHGFSAREKPTRLEAFLARRARGLATPPEAKRMKNPLAPTALTIAEARDHIADDCAICHAHDGGGEASLNEGLYPLAPALR